MNFIGIEITNYYSLSRPTYAQHKYINNILHTHIASTPTCFNASASSSGSLNLVLAKVTK